MRQSFAGGSDIPPRRQDVLLPLDLGKWGRLAIAGDISISGLAKLATPRMISANDETDIRLWGGWVSVDPGESPQRPGLHAA